MPDIGLSIIVPTIGRAGLSRTLRSIRDQGLGPDDEVLVVGDTLDGPLPEVERMVAAVGPPFRYAPHAGPRHFFGFPQINHGRRLARPGNYLLTLPDDDVYVADALNRVRAAIRVAEGRQDVSGFGETEPDTAPAREPRPLMFQFLSPMGIVLPNRPEVALANVSNQCFVVPNLPGRVADLRCERYESDYDWIVETLALWPPNSLVWVDQVIVHARPAAGVYPELRLAEPVRLTVGSGRYRILGDFVHVDIDPSVNPDLVADARALPYEDASVDEIFAGHVLEHFDWDEGQQALAEWKRVLRPGGKLGVVVPDFHEIARRYIANTGDVIEWPEGTQRAIRDLRTLNDVFIYSYAQDSPHRYCYDRRLLREALEAAGFVVTAEIDRQHDPRIAVGAWYQTGWDCVKPCE